MAALVFLELLAGCVYRPERKGYDRELGEWPAPEYQTPEERAATAQKSVTRPRSGEKSLDKAIEPWLGTPYLYGGNTKKGADCSGFVGEVMKDWAGISLPRTADGMSKVGKKIGRKELRAGDAVFFGQWNKVDHVGISLDRERFVHASSSKGVMISRLDDPYWAKRYKGARRF